MSEKPEETSPAWTGAKAWNSLTKGKGSSEPSEVKAPENAVEAEPAPFLPPSKPAPVETPAQPAAQPTTQPVPVPKVNPWKNVTKVL